LPSTEIPPKPRHLLDNMIDNVFFVLSYYSDGVAVYCMERAEKSFSSSVINAIVGHRTSINAAVVAVHIVRLGLVLPQQPATFRNPEGTD
jgi:hypothetical protein